MSSLTFIIIPCIYYIYPGQYFHEPRYSVQTIHTHLFTGKMLQVMFAEGADIPLTIVKSDGGFTYDTSDMACMRHRIEEEKANWLVYVTDAGQAQHFKVGQ